MKNSHLIFTLHVKFNKQNPSREDCQIIEKPLQL